MGSLAAEDEPTSRGLPRGAVGCPLVASGLAAGAEVGVVVVEAPMAAGAPGKESLNIRHAICGFLYILSDLLVHMTFNCDKTTA